MKIRHRRASFLLLLLTLYAANSAACMDEALMTQQYHVIGKAYNSDNQLIYIEKLRHSSNKSGGQLITEYILPDGNALAVKQVDYDCRPTSPAYSLQNPDGSISESVYWAGENISSYIGGEAKVLKVPNGDNIFDAGFDNYIKMNWESLMAGKKMKVNYLFARKNRFLKLKLARSETPAFLLGEAGSDIVFFKIGANNLILRMLSDPIYVGYEVSTRTLKYYSGPSNLPMMSAQKSLLIRYQNARI